MTGLLDRLAELREAATPGPWAALLSDILPESALADDHPQWYAVATTYIPARAASQRQNNNDADLIVAAVNALPLLLRIARAAEQGLAALDLENEMWSSTDEAEPTSVAAAAELRSALASLGDTE